MATFVCKKCSNEVDVRCKPKKCPKCGTEGKMEKKEKN